MLTLPKLPAKTTVARYLAIAAGAVAGFDLITFQFFHAIGHGIVAGLLYWIGLED